MADHGTAIEWTQAPGYKGETWNPVTGCDRVSPGCANCYALDLAARLKRMGQPRYQRDGDPKTSGPGFGLTLHPDKLEEPLRWRKPRMVFVNSMSDLFHEEIPQGYIDDVFATMAMAPRHIFQVLTKRPERMRDYFTDGKPWERVANRCYKIHRYGSRGRQVATRQAWPLPNVWLGVSIENRRFVDRADLLRETPAAVRFISAEPLIGPLVGAHETAVEEEMHYDWPDDDYTGPPLSLLNIDWLICGGESGPRHRPIDPDWVRDLLWECKQMPHPYTGWTTAFFMKQWGGRTPKAGGRELDGRTWDEWPTSLQPTSEAA
jgi:protein gp37